LSVALVTAGLFIELSWVSANALTCANPGLAR
jgi:hypothetical protein